MPGRRQHGFLDKKIPRSISAPGVKALLLALLSEGYVASSTSLSLLKRRLIQACAAGLVQSSVGSCSPSRLRSATNLAHKSGLVFLHDLFVT